MSQIVFDHPSETFSPQQTTVDLFLYDIREDFDLRSNECVVEETKDTHERRRLLTHRPPLRIACSYLVTAWPVGGTDLALQEQRLLGQVLLVFARMPVIPANLLHGALRGQSPALPMITALVDPQKNLSEFWTALGSQLRPSLTITVTFSMDILPPEDSAMVISTESHLGTREGEEMSIVSASRGRQFRIGGRVVDAGGRPVPRATVSLAGSGLRARTDAEGRFVLARVPGGPGRLCVRAGKNTQEIDVQVPPRDGDSYDVQLP